MQIIPLTLLPLILTYCITRVPVSELRNHYWYITIN